MRDRRFVSAILGSRWYPIGLAPAVRDRYTHTTMPEPSSSLAAAPSSDEGPEPRQRFSEVLNDLASRPSPTIAISDVLSAFGDRAFGALMLLFAAPNILPLPPGTSAVLGAPLLFITAQLMLGRSTLWMPAFIRERSIQRDFFALLTAKLSPVLARGERLLKPRLPSLLHPAPERLVGAACLLLAVILFLPIPFGNIPPAFAISAFALGILERDGIAALVSWIATIGSVLILAAISSAILAGIRAFLDQLWVLIG